MKRLMLVVNILVVASMLLSACATPTPEVIEKVVTQIVTQVVKETVKETVIVAGTPQVVEKEVTKVVEKEVTKVVTEKETVIVEVEKEEPEVKTRIVYGAALEGATVIVDPARMPTTFNEAPMLAERVAAGELPPVEERLPKEPLVLEPLHEIGEYGGELTGGTLGTYASSEIMNRPSGMDKLIFWDPTGTKHIPSVAKGWEHSEDGRELTFFLREGMRWSDGELFTAEDIRFWWEDVYMNDDLNPTHDAVMQTNGVDPTFEVLDDYTVRWTFQDPYWTILNVFAASYSVVSRGIPLAFWLPGGPYHPAHYMKQFHADYADAADLEKMIKDEELESWVALYTQQVGWDNNLDMPTLSPWLTTQARTSDHWLLERNPYFWVVDTEGNQLPYVDTWAITAVPDREVMKMRVAAGEFTYQYRRLDHQALPLLAEFGEQNNYTVYLDTATNGSLQQIMFNMAYALDDEILKWNRTADFRRAVCMALDRDQFNEAFYFGMAVPGSPMPLPGNPDSPGEDPWRTKWHTYDPDASNALLDSIGLDQKDSEGFRLRTDGSGDRLTFELPLSDIEIYPESLEMITQMLADVGIHVVTPPMGNQLIGTRQPLDEIMWNKEYNWGAERIFMSADAGRFNFPLTTGTWLGEALSLWFQTGGEEGMSPDFDPELVRVMELYREGLGSTMERQAEIAQEMWKIAVEQVYACGIVGGLSLWPRAWNNDLGNVPQGVCFDFHCRFPGLARAEQIYWTDPARRE